MLAKLKVSVTLIEILFHLAKSILDYIKKVEEDDPDDGKKNGEYKKELVLKIVSSIYDGAEDIFKNLPIDKDKFLKTAENIIEAGVYFYNAIGFFRK